MSKERELLEHCLEEFFYHGVSCPELCIDIKKLLAQPEHIPDVGNMVKQEPVAWMYDWNTLAEEEYGDIKYDALTRAESITNNRAITNIRPLYTSPPKRDPLSDDEVCKELKLCRLSTEWDSGFEAGVGFAEDFHGIGGEE